MHTSAPTPWSRSTSTDDRWAPRRSGQRQAITSRYCAGPSSTASNATGRSKTAGISHVVSNVICSALERLTRVNPKLMAHVRDSARTYGKPDPIDALAVARAALREPDLPIARLDGPDRDVSLLVDHREDLVGERTRIIARLRWHLHELDPGWEPKARALDRPATWNEVRARLARAGGEQCLKSVDDRGAGRTLPVILRLSSKTGAATLVGKVRPDAHRSSWSWRR